MEAADKAFVLQKIGEFVEGDCNAFMGSNAQDVQKDAATLSLTIAGINSFISFALSLSFLPLFSAFLPLLRTGVSLTFDPDICVLQECLCALSAL